MVFFCGLERPTQPSCDEGAPGVPEDVSDYESLVMEACSALRGSDCRFQVRGFGSNDWRLDVGYDLSAFMEQFPDLLAGIEARDQIEVDFYSQGIERSLVFSPEGDIVDISCFSRTDWQPDPKVERIDRGELKAMLRRLATDFSASLRVIDSPIIQVEPFSSWLVEDL